MTAETRWYQAVVCLLFAMAMQAQEPSELSEAPTRADGSNHLCSWTGGICLDRTWCCEQTDLCLKPPTPRRRVDDPTKKRDFSETASGERLQMNGQRRGFCMNTQGRDPSRNYIASGQPCQDSRDCQTGCCRELRGGRFIHITCGASADDTGEHTCIMNITGPNDP